MHATASGKGAKESHFAHALTQFQGQAGILLKTLHGVLGWAILTMIAVDPALAAMTEHQQQVAAWRAGRVERLTADDGWLSLIGLHWLPANTTQTLGNGEGNDVDLQVGPARLGTLEWTDGLARFEVAAGAAVTVDGQPATAIDLSAADGARRSSSASDRPTSS